MSQEWFFRIMNLVPKKMQKNQREIKKINEEIKEDYAFAVKKSVVDFVLKEPEIDEDERFLDEDDETPMTIELAGVSEAWKKLYKQSRRFLTHNLHLINQCMVQSQNLWQNKFVNSRDLPFYMTLERKGINSSNSRIRFRLLCEGGGGEDKVILITSIIFAKN